MATKKGTQNSITNTTVPTDKELKEQQLNQAAQIQHRKDMETMTNQTTIPDNRTPEKPAYAGKEQPVVDIPLKAYYIGAKTNNYDPTTRDWTYKAEDGEYHTVTHIDLSNPNTIRYYMSIYSSYLTNAKGEPVYRRYNDITEEMATPKALATIVKQLVDQKVILYIMDYIYHSDRKNKDYIQTRLLSKYEAEAINIKNQPYELI